MSDFNNGQNPEELENAVADYLELVVGERPVIVPISATDLARLPLYLGHAWHLRRTLLFGREIAFAFPKDCTRRGLTRIAKDCAALTSRLGVEVVPVIPDIRSYERRQLVQKRIPFVTPGKQLFLPMFLADFRESFSAPRQAPRETMSWISQVIVLRHLLDGGIAERPLAEVAETLGYTAMAVTHGVRELVSLGLCAKVPRGRAKVVQFALESHTLWDRALVHMRSPVARCYPVATPIGQTPDAIEAGLNALSRNSDLAYDGPRILAMPNREIKRLIDAGVVETRWDEGDSDLVLEGWHYRPRLTSDGPAVDDFSLFLSLRDDPDERVQTALAGMMERRTW